MAKVYFVREEISIEVPVGTSVLEAEIQAGLAPDVPCGGQGTCGKCLVKVDGKPVLACQTKVEKDCQVEIPRKKNRGKILSERISRKVNFSQLQVKTVWLEKPELGKKIKWERLVEDVYGISDNKRTSDVDYGCIKTDVKLAGSLYEKRSFNPEWQVAYTDEEILDLRPIVGVHEDSVHGVNSSGEKGDGIFTAAIDLGTTTIVGYLLDGRTGENLAVESRMNPQMQYGGDVIQRANYALEHGTETLSKCVQKTINKILESLIVKTQKAPKIASGRKKVNDQTVNGKTKSAEWMPGEDIYQVSLVGNTCLPPVFLEFTRLLWHAPYTPAISQSLTLRAAIMVFTSTRPVAPSSEYRPDTWAQTPVAVFWLF